MIDAVVTEAFDPIVQTTEIPVVRVEQALEGVEVEDRSLGIGSSADAVIDL